MSFLRRFIAVALLALWLPATLHCDLEAAGLDIAFVCHDHDHADDHGHSHPTPDPADHCDGDACHTLEGTAINPTSVVKLVGEATFFLITLLPTPPENPVDRLCPERTDVPPEFVQGWRFVERCSAESAAPPVLA